MILPHHNTAINAACMAGKKRHLSTYYALAYEMARPRSISSPIYATPQEPHHGTRATGSTKSSGITDAAHHIRTRLDLVNQRLARVGVALVAAKQVKRTASLKKKHECSSHGCTHNSSSVLLTAVIVQATPAIQWLCVRHASPSQMPSPKQPKNIKPMSKLNSALRYI